MVFTSLNFLIFFPVVTIAYWLTPAKYRWVTLLAASYFFYINIKPIFALLLAFVTTSTYFFTKLIDVSPVESKKKMYMIINIILILIPLFFFKYFASINKGIFSVLELMHVRWPLPDIKWVLPIGISFYTFMAVGYTIDVYNEEIESEKNIGILALFISFFPLLLSGPIERAKNMLPQFNNPAVINYTEIIKGLKLMLWGYFMKLVVADRIGMYVDAIYSHLPQHNGTSLLFTAFLYPFQVYADLGGYTLIAIGTAKAMGIKVMQNFKRPFFATSISEFWRRWHISLITWLTDYVYTPISFSFRKYKIWGIVISLMITFFISGLWHGAALTFIVWGLLQGTFLSIEALMGKSRTNFENKFMLSGKAWYILLACTLTFILFAVSQIFARSESFNDAKLFYSKIFTSHGSLYMDMTTLSYSIFGLTILFLKDFMDEYFPKRILLFENNNKIVRYTSYLVVFFLIIIIGVLDNSQFIYFQF